MRSTRFCRRSVVQVPAGDRGWGTSKFWATANASTLASSRQSRTQRQVTIFAALACHHANDHPLAIDVADLKACEFGASHAGTVERHQQRPSKQCSGCIDQARDFLSTEHSWQSAAVFGIGQELPKLRSLEGLNKEEAQSGHTVHRSAGCYLALFEQIGLIASQFVRPELIRRLTKMPGKGGHDLQILPSRDIGVVATLQLLQHHFSQMGHRNLLSL